jgi:hypothetical protein
MPEIHGGTDWYRAQPEPERVLRGVLGEHIAPQGPGGRAALRYALISEDGQLPIYAPNGGRELAQFLGKEVVAHAKVVDLSREGFGLELWIGSVEAA